MKLFINNVNIGEYWNIGSDWGIDIKQNLQPDNGDTLFQLAYYNRDFAEFFAIYGYCSKDGVVDYYLLDLRNQEAEGLKEYHATKLSKDTDIDKLTIEMITEE